ncbi:hypothetical protein [Microbacterium sp. MM2322]|uniref:hypothetical protein n=1 Tax=Microbacterium sp. MM2322 TaxID=3157631 RepID=UPI0032D59555
MQADWIEHRRSDDGELLGWMKPVGEGFVVVDLLGRTRTDAVDWLTAEECLDALGLTYLADRYEFRLNDGSWLKVRIAEVSPTGIRLQKDDWGSVSATELYYSTPFPVSPDTLRPLS